VTSCVVGVATTLHALNEWRSVTARSAGVAKLPVNNAHVLSINTPVNRRLASLTRSTLLTTALQVDIARFNSLLTLMTDD